MFFKKYFYVIIRKQFVKVIILNKEKTIKTVSLIFIDIFFMAVTYIIADLIFNKANLTIDPNFPKFIPLLILIKIGIYFIAGLYKEETRGIIFEISCVTLANIIVFILVRFILKVGVSTYLQLIALTAVSYTHLQSLRLPFFL